MILAVNTTIRLLLLRQLLHDPAIVGDRPLSAYLVPANGAHNGVGLPPCLARLSYISGFTGDSGMALVTEDDALLWTNEEYFDQAKHELDINWRLMRGGDPGGLTIDKYLASELLPGSLIGADPSLINAVVWKTMQENLDTVQQKLVPVARNLIDRVQDRIDRRPFCPTRSFVQVPVEISGKSTIEKLVELRYIMDFKMVEAVVLVQLDDIAWLLNLRGFDIPHTALFLSYMIVKRDDFELFIDSLKLTKHVRETIIRDGGKIFGYDQIADRLSYLVMTTTGNILLDKSSSHSLVDAVQPISRQLIEISPVNSMKAEKNPTELEAFRNALVREAAYLSRFYGWLTHAVSSGQVVTEISASEKLNSFRKDNHMFLASSSPMIAAVDSNAGIPYYVPSKATNKRILPSSIFLLSSVAVYLDGTTDITRTYHFGVPTDYQRECYTRILKGQIAIAKLVFPKFTRGYQLDTLARKFLWEAGMDYGHSTGHGIGISLHDGLSVISKDHCLATDDMGLQEDTVLSIEPGYYEEGSFGMRLENIVRVVNSTMKDNKGVHYLTMEDLTYFPYQHKMIKKSLLTQDEINYINQYQMKCRSVIGQFLLRNDFDDEAYLWVVKETQPL